MRGVDWERLGLDERAAQWTGSYCEWREGARLKQREINRLKADTWRLSQIGRKTLYRVRAQQRRATREDAFASTLSSDLWRVPYVWDLAQQTQLEAR